MERQIALRYPCRFRRMRRAGISSGVSHVRAPLHMPLDPLGRYEILQELGRGAMGVVYKARDPLIDRTVAIKSVDLDASIEQADAFERRFYREAKSAGRLNHLN